MDVVERLPLEAANANTLIAAEHVHRYELASELAAGKRVLDLCCGTGYGSAILARTAASVVGVDNDAGAVDAAAAAFRDQGTMTFRAADAARYLHTDEAASFDLIVCFEGLEHLHALDDALESLRRLTREGAQLVFSVPNSKTLGEENEFHVTDFDLERLEGVLAGFEDPAVLQQHLAEASLITGDDGDAGDPDATRAVLRGQAEAEYANHYVVFVNVPPEARAGMAGSARGVIAVAPRHNRWLLELERQNRELWTINARLARERWGMFDGAAASVLDGLRERTAEVEQLRHDVAFVRSQLEEWEREGRRLRAERDAVELRYRELRARKVVRLGLALARARPRLRS